jgi:hypothetical protein
VPHGNGNVGGLYTMTTAVAGEQQQQKKKICWTRTLPLLVQTHHAGVDGGVSVVVVIFGYFFSKDQDKKMIL